MPAAFHGGTNDVLLTGLVVAIADWCRRRGRGSGPAVLLDLEGVGKRSAARRTLGARDTAALRHVSRMEGGRRADMEQVSVLHRRDPFDPKTRRVMHRSQIKGNERIT